MTRIAVLGGTFDPVHLGHLTIAEQVRMALDARETWLVPARVPPQRQQPVGTPEQRLRMAEAAIEGRTGLRILDIEIRRSGPSFTIDTLTELGAQHPTAEFWFIVGADVAASVATWHRAEALLELANFAIVNRTGAAPIPKPCWGFDLDRARVLQVSSPRISSADIRARVAAGEPIDHLTPQPVASLIAELGLYKLR